MAKLLIKLKIQYIKIKFQIIRIKNILTKSINKYKLVKFLMKINNFKNWIKNENIFIFILKF